MGDFIAFNGYLGIIIRPIISIGMIINFVQRAKASADRIHVLFQQQPEIIDVGISNSQDKTDQWDKGIEGRIEFNNLTFSYGKNDPPALKNIDLTIEPGKTLGIIGKVGSGKSTIANLILRLYNPLEEDQLLIDGVDITKVPLRLLGRV